jgi:hypothetical protein
LFHFGNFTGSQNHWRLGSLSGLGESATSHGQGQSGSSGSDSELLHTSNSCFYWKSAVTLVSRVTGDIANAVPTFSVV